MQKAKELLDTMVQDYSATSKPTVVLDSVSQLETESFELQYQAGKLLVRGDNPLAAIYGWRRALEAVRSGYIRENLGRVRPEFPLRVFSARNSEEIPELILSGFNAVIVEGTEGIAKYRDYGLKIIALWNEDLNLKDFDAVMCTCRWQDTDIPGNKTRIEWIEEDLKLREDLARGQCALIYELPYVGEREEVWISWLKRLCLIAQEGTILAFSNKCPSDTWEMFQRAVDPIVTPLLVIMDSDDHQGFKKMSGHNVAGVLSGYKNLKLFV